MTGTLAEKLAAQREAKMRPEPTAMTLSNGTQLRIERKSAGLIEVSVEPDGRAMTNDEWSEYCKIAGQNASRA